MKSNKFLCFIFLIFLSPQLYSYIPGDYETFMGGERNIKHIWGEFKGNIYRFEEYSTNVAETSRPILHVISSFITDMDERMKGGPQVDSGAISSQAKLMVDLASASRTSVTILNQLIFLMDTALTVKRYDILATLSPAMFYLNPILALELQKKMGLPFDFDDLISKQEDFKKRFGFHNSTKKKGKRVKVDVTLACLGTTTAYHCIKFIENKTGNLWLKKEKILKDTQTALIRHPLSGPSLAVSQEEYDRALKSSRTDLAEMFQSAISISDLAKAIPKSAPELTSQIQIMEKKLNELRGASNKAGAERINLSPEEIQNVFNFLKGVLSETERLIETNRLKSFSEFSRLKEYYDEIIRRFEGDPKIRQALKNLFMLNISARDTYNAFRMATSTLSRNVREVRPYEKQIGDFGELLYMEYVEKQSKRPGVERVKLVEKIKQYGSYICDLVGNLNPGCQGGKKLGAIGFAKELPPAFSKLLKGHKPNWKQILKAYPIDPKINRIIIKPPKDAKAFLDENYWKNWQYEILLGRDGRPIEYEIFNKYNADIPRSWKHEPMPYVYQAACLRFLPTNQDYCVDDVIFRKNENSILGASCTIAGFRPVRSVHNSVSPTGRNLNDWYLVQGEEVYTKKYIDRPPPTEKLNRLYKLHRGYPILGSDHFRYGFEILCRELVDGLNTGENLEVVPFQFENQNLGTHFKLVHKCTKNCIGRPTQNKDLQLELPGGLESNKSITTWREILRTYPMDTKLNRLIIKPPKGAKTKLDENFWKNWQYEILLGRDGRPIEYEIFNKFDADFPLTWKHDPIPFVYQAACVRYLPTNKEYCVDDVIFRKKENSIFGTSCTIASFMPTFTLAANNKFSKDLYLVQGEKVLPHNYENQKPATEKLFGIFKLHQGLPILSSDHLVDGFRIRCRELEDGVKEGVNDVISPFYYEKDILDLNFKLVHKCKKNCIGRPTQTHDLFLELPSVLSPKLGQP